MEIILHLTVENSFIMQNIGNQLNNKSKKEIEKEMQDAFNKFPKL